MLFNRRKLELPTPEQALKGRTEQWFTLAEDHVVLDAPVVTNADNIPEGFEVAVFGLGCFWGAEEIFWRMPGVWSTSVGRVRRRHDPAPVVRRGVLGADRPHRGRPRGLRPDEGGLRRPP